MKINREKRERCRGRANVEEEKEMYELAVSFYNAGRYKDAEKLFHLLTGMQPLAKSYWKGLAAAYQMQGSYQDALSAYTAAAYMDEGQKDPFCASYAAECLFKLGDYEKALMALSDAISIATQNRFDESLVDRLKLLQNRWIPYAKNTSLSYESKP